jgi:2-polyprenyl-3-methyl-5-hydroxy-6-metoxy-1,4-benzoquinol methylase
VNFLHQFDDIADFLADVRATVLKQDNTTQKDFDVFANEAFFGLSVIKDDLSHLAQGAEIMEVGAGMLLLSGYLTRKGFHVHALEPIGEGFSLFHTLQTAVLRYYKKNGIHLNLIESAIENFSDAYRFDYIFSINVFEHINNIEIGLANSYRSLRAGGSLRVYCPNYLFPYEPHFNIPTLLGKRFTEIVFKSRIFGSSRFSQTKEIWDGLNWINVMQVKKFFRRYFGHEPAFNRMATYQIMRRILDDQPFRERRSGWIVTIFQIIERCGLIKLFKFVPVIFSPVMDFRIQHFPLEIGKV